MYQGEVLGNLHVLLPVSLALEVMGLLAHELIPDNTCPFTIRWF